jgi:hypothetical protein
LPELNPWKPGRFGSDCVVEQQTIAAPVDSHCCAPPKKNGPAMDRKTRYVALLRASNSMEVDQGVLLLSGGGNLSPRISCEGHRPATLASKSVSSVSRNVQSSTHSKRISRLTSRKL